MDVFREMLLNMNRRDDQLKNKIDRMKKVLADKSIAEADKYRKIREIILSCKREERSCIQIILKCDIGTYERANEFKGIISIFVSICALIFSVAVPYLQRHQDIVRNANIELMATNSNAGIQELYTLELAQNQNTLKLLLGMILIIETFAILLYLGVNLYASRHIRESTCLLEIVNKYI